MKTLSNGRKIPQFQGMVDEEPKYFKYFICLCYFSHRVSKVLRNQQKIGIMLRTISDKQNSRTFSSNGSATQRSIVCSVSNK